MQVVYEINAFSSERSSYINQKFNGFMVPLLRSGGRTFLFTLQHLQWPLGSLSYTPSLLLPAMHWSMFNNLLSGDETKLNQTKIKQNPPKPKRPDLQWLPILWCKHFHCGHFMLLE